MRWASISLLSLLALSLAGGLAVAPLSRGSFPFWATWGARSIVYEDPSVADGFLGGNRADAFLCRSTEFVIYPERMRASYEEYRLFRDSFGFTRTAEPPARMIREANAGVRYSFRGSVGPVVGIWSWHYHTSKRVVPQHPESGVVRLLGIPLAYRPIFPGFLIGWVAAYGLV